MSAPHIILDCLPSLCQKLSDLVEFWRSYNKNNFACFFETRCIVIPHRPYNSATITTMQLWSSNYFSITWRYAQWLFWQESQTGHMAIGHVVDVQRPYGKILSVWQTSQTQSRWDLLGHKRYYRRVNGEERLTAGQAVISGGQQSKWLPITRSVVQGSGIGPSAYPVYSMDLKALSSYNSILKYATTPVFWYLNIVSSPSRKNSRMFRHGPLRISFKLI